MSVMAARPIDIWNPASLPYTQSMQCHFAEGLSRNAQGQRQLDGNQYCTLADATAPAFGKSEARNASPSSLVIPNIVSPAATPSMSSLQSSPAVSPAQTPEYGEKKLTGKLQPVQLPRVMSAGEARQHRRKQATRREARRAIAIRKAFTSLEECLPGHEERSLTRLEILDLASNYIQDLNRALKQCNGRAPAPRFGPGNDMVHCTLQQQQDHQQAPGMIQHPALAHPTPAFGPIRVDTPPAEPVLVHHACMTGSVQQSTPAPRMAIPATSHQWPRRQLSHEPMPLQHPAQVSRFQSLTSTSAPAQGIYGGHSNAAPVPQMTNGQQLDLTPDLTMLDIDELFHRSESLPSDGSASWTDFLDDNLADGTR